MAKQKGGEIVVGLDIGTTKICAIVGELSENGIDIIGIPRRACARAWW